MSRPRAVVSWSGGKDGCLALLRRWDTYDVRAMVTMFDESGARSRSHGLRPEVIAAQAARLGVRTISASCSWASYTDDFVRALDGLAADGVTHIVFGDIFEDAHREWTEQVASRAGLIADQPLWNESTRTLTLEFLARGGQAMLVTTRDEYLDRNWLGRSLSPGMVDEFERRGIDPGGERGEYHTIVTGCPLFSSPLVLETGDIVARGGCSAIDLLLPAGDAVEAR